MNGRLLSGLAACGLALVVAASTALAAVGDLDTSFSNDGKRTTPFGNGANIDQAEGLTIQPNGKILAVGVSFQGASGDDLAIARFNVDGSLDQAFSGDGRRTVSFGPDTDNGNAAAIQPNGRIVVVGATNNGTIVNVAVVRFMPDGGLDQSFAGDGKRVISFAGGGEAEAVAILPSGKIVVAGFGGGGNPLAIARLLPGGALDTTFSGDGKRTSALANAGIEGEGVTVQQDGRLAAVDEQFGVARYTASGSLNQGFSGDGKRPIAFSGVGDKGNAVAVQGNGKVVAAGHVNEAATGDDFAAARLNPNGSLDQGFSGDGKQTLSFGAGASVDHGEGVAIQSDGKVVIAGDTDQGAGSEFAIARLDTNGDLDQSFAGDGRKVISFNNGTNPDGALAVALQQNGRIVAAGFSDQGATTTEDFAVVRLLGG